MESFSIMRVHWKIWNQYTGREIALKGGVLGQFAGLRRGLTKKEGVLFLRGGGSYDIVSLTLKTSPNIVGDILWRCF